MQKYCTQKKLVLFYLRRKNMILEIKFNDFRFFSNNCTLSASANSRTKWLLSNAQELDNRNVLKAIGIYGANNSGKSNLVSLFSLIKGVLLGKSAKHFNSPLFNDPRYAFFSIIFNNQNGRGWMKYEFMVDSKELSFVRERLSNVTYYVSGSPLEKNIFTRDIQNKTLSVFGNDNSKYMSVIPSRLPFLYSVELESGVFAPLKEYIQELKTLANSIEIIQMYNIPLVKTIDACKNGDENKKKFITEFVKSADLSISDFGYEKETKKVNIDDRISELVLNSLDNDIDALHLTTTYGSIRVPSIFFDSSGTKKIQAVASYIYDSILNGKTLVVDELDNGLHYMLTRAIVSSFNNIANEKGQLIFTAHDLLLIDCKTLMRKEQIYFLERGNNGARFFCLNCFNSSNSGVREASDLIKRYNHGDFGAIPSPNFIKEILHIGNENGK